MSFKNKQPKTECTLDIEKIVNVLSETDLKQLRDKINEEISSHTLVLYYTKQEYDNELEFWDKVDQIGINTKFGETKDELIKRLQKSVDTSYNEVEFVEVLIKAMRKYERRKEFKQNIVGFFKWIKAGFKKKR